VKRKVRKKRSRRRSRHALLAPEPRIPPVVRKENRESASAAILAFRRYLEENTHQKGRSGQRPFRLRRRLSSKYKDLVDSKKRAASNTKKLHRGGKNEALHKEGANASYRSKRGKKLTTRKRKKRVVLLSREGKRDSSREDHPQEKKNGFDGPQNEGSVKGGIGDKRSKILHRTGGKKVERDHNWAFLVGATREGGKDREPKRIE